MDGDVVETSNLHRQIVHSQESVKRDMSKVESAVEGCRKLNSEIEYVAHHERISVQNALGVIGGYDLVLDCTDNPASRYLISDSCVILNKTLVSGAAQRLEGQVVVLNYPTTITNDGGEVKTRGPCYRCTFPRPPDPEMVRGCSEIGILGPVVGCIGTVMASEAIRIIVQGAHLGVPQVRKASMLLYNAWPADPKSMFRTVMLMGRRKGCVACGDEEVLRDLGKKKISREGFQIGSVDYEAWCGRVEDVRVLGRENRVRAREFLEGISKGLVVDVREENEYLVGAKVRGSVNIPISRILRDPREAFEGVEEQVVDGVADEHEEPRAAEARSIYFICQQGNDSQIAAQKLMDLDKDAGRRREWIGDVEGGFVAMERP